MSNPNDPAQSTDPYQEPPNSTVDDWHGQIVENAAEQADEALDGGESEDEAAARYEEAVESTEGAAERDRP